ncbi:unnamed protein product [Protopolystoma xenopodis]|uniref:Secreted protein n=1 Tax=Protopolystoma xenopodis TaxID=117903 RepID=A0A448XD45_9PLAT|nr:unnamed protein product [Protopolystoma xenopodis]
MILQLAIILFHFLTVLSRMSGSLRASQAPVNLEKRLLCHQQIHSPCCSRGPDLSPTRRNWYASTVLMTRRSKLISFICFLSSFSTASLLHISIPEDALFGGFSVHSLFLSLSLYVCSHLFIMLIHFHLHTYTYTDTTRGPHLNASNGTCFILDRLIRWCLPAGWLPTDSVERATTPTQRVSPSFCLPGGMATGSAKGQCLTHLPICNSPDGCILPRSRADMDERTCTVACLDDFFLRRKIIKTVLP